MRIRYSGGTYEARFWDNASFIERLVEVPGALFVVDAEVARLYGESALACLPAARAFQFRAEESRKDFSGVEQILDWLIASGMRKGGTLVSVGGGIVQDVTGFVAHVLYRGVRWVYVPTTLLAQSDSCIGSKTSLNYKGFKNLLGTFRPPAEVHISSAFLGTLQDKEFFSGAGEIVKLALIGGASATDAFRAELGGLRRREPAATLKTLQAALEIKKGYIERDEFDRGPRNLLNFGHCFGHALESSSDFAIPHGQAVTIGILFANLVAVERGLLDRAAADRLAEELLLPLLTLRPKPEHLLGDRILEGMRRDKKRSGRGLALVMMGDGHKMSKVDDLTDEEALRALARLQTLLSSETAGTRTR
jgi:3-dehydroquinate synthase